MADEGGLNTVVSDVDEALKVVAGALRMQGRRVVRRGKAVIEIPGLTSLTITQPLHRLALNPARQLNPWVSLAEFPWLMAGRCDIGWLLPYLPRAADYSDDGRYWRAGYGPRLRSWGSQHFAAGQKPLDQVAKVVEILIADPMTRQAVIALWDPVADLGAQSRDLPCTNWLHFQAREVEGAGGKSTVLDLTVMMRSNDVLWGFSGVNVVNFTLLLELVARFTGMAVGCYRHVTTNMHVYEEHAQRLGAIQSGVDVYPALSTRSLGMDAVTGLDEFTFECRRMLETLENTRHIINIGSGCSTDPWVTQWGYFMSLHKWLDEKKEWEWWLDALSPVKNSAWCLAAARFLARRDPRYQGRVLGFVVDSFMTEDSGAEYMNATMKGAHAES